MNDKLGFIKHPYASLVIGLALVQIAKLIYIPNYIFNFLTTLVHEIGHSLFAWLMGMPSIPTVSVAGGGVTLWQDQVMILAIAIMAGLVGLAYLNRERKWLLILCIIGVLVYPLFAFTNGKFALALAGGMILEVVGAAVCFTVCLGARLELTFERPLYALWGWWMLINRMTEAFLMLTNKTYRDATRIIESGLAAGLPHDVTQITELLRISAEPVLLFILFLGVLSLPCSMIIAYFMTRYRE